MESTNYLVSFAKISTELAFKSKLETDYAEYKNGAIVFIEDTKKIYCNGIYYGGSNDTLDLIAYITYKDLVDLRDQGKLIPGLKYRITDYTCTTTLEGTRSAGNDFDIIVTALNERVLSEEATAGPYDGNGDDTYFKFSKLEAWKLWYSLDNDSKRFLWADEENGKGVIYRMIDEFGNDCPYDFKNIQFKRYALMNFQDLCKIINPKCSIDAPDINCLNCSLHTIIPTGMKETNYFKGHEFVTNEGEVAWRYTFDGEIGDLNGYDQSVTYENLDAFPGKPHDNIIASYKIETKYDDNVYSTQALNDIVFMNYYLESLSDTEYCIYNNIFNKNCFNITMSLYSNNNKFASGCNNIICSRGCMNNIFGSKTSFNIIGQAFRFNYLGTLNSRNCFGANNTHHKLGNKCECISLYNDNTKNTFGINCLDISIYYANNNIFGNNCSSIFLNNPLANYTCDNNIFGVNCSSLNLSSSCNNNTFGNNCSSINLSVSCYTNTFDVSCSSINFTNKLSYHNKFGAKCRNIKFKDYCYANQFSHECYDISFGSYCYSNSFGNNCYYNTFGNYCNSNSFGNNCGYNTFGNYCNSNSFGNNCGSNSFGNDCGYNTFGNYCYSNSFGNDCSGNTFGNYCYSNSFGNSCYYNTFGNNCGSNSFGNNDYMYNCEICNGVQYIEIKALNTTYSNKMQYIKILSGITGDYNNNVSIGKDLITLNATYNQTIGKTSSGKLLSWTDADLVDALSTINL